MSMSLWKRTKPVDQDQTPKRWNTWSNTNGPPQLWALEGLDQKVAIFVVLSQEIDQPLKQEVLPSAEHPWTQKTPLVDVPNKCCRKTMDIPLLSLDAARVSLPVSIWPTATPRSWAWWHRAALTCEGATMVLTLRPSELCCWQWCIDYNSGV